MIVAKVYVFQTYSRPEIVTLTLILQQIIPKRHLIWIPVPARLTLMSFCRAAISSAVSSLAAVVSSIKASLVEIALSVSVFSVSLAARSLSQKAFWASSFFCSSLRTWLAQSTLRDPLRRLQMLRPLLDTQYSIRFMWHLPAPRTSLATVTH